MGKLFVKDKIVLVDDEDMDRLEPYSWFVSKNGYVQGTMGKGRGRPRGYIHRIIMNCPKGMVVDHLNKDKLDNRKSNLMITSHRMNCLGKKEEGKTSRFIGVSFSKEIGKWVAQGTCLKKNKNRRLGSFEKEIDAALKYDLHAICQLGIQAKTNLLPPMDKNVTIEVRGKYDPNSKHFIV